MKIITGARRIIDHLKRADASMQWLLRQHLSDQSQHWITLQCCMNVKLNDRQSQQYQDKKCMHTTDGRKPLRAFMRSACRSHHNGSSRGLSAAVNTFSGTTVSGRILGTCFTCGGSVYSAMHTCTDEKFERRAF